MHAPEPQSESRESRTEVTRQGIEFLLLYPVYEAEQPIEPLLRAMEAQKPGNYIVEVVDLTPEGLPPSFAQAAQGWDTRVRFRRAEFLNPAQMINAALEEHRDSKFLLPLAAGVLPLPHCLLEIERAFQADEDIGCVFANFEIRLSNGARETVDLLDWTPGVVHERHEFGVIQAYRIQALREIEGIREDLRYAADYDLMLRLTDDYTYQRVATPLARIEEANLAAPGEPQLPDTSRLPLPGEPPFGGFTYLSYPEEIEEEVTAVFEQMLHRRGFWIDQPTRPLPAVPVSPTDLDVSVIIPVQNGERLIANAIQKVLHGSHQRFEVLVADAGSGDRTREVVQKFMARDHRVRLIVNESGSRVAAVNEALRQARGRYIAELEWDDELAPDALEKMIAYMKAHPGCALAVSYYEFIDEDGTPVADAMFVKHEGCDRNQLLRHDGVGALRMIPRIVFKELGYYDAERYASGAEVYDFALKISEQFEMGKVPAPLYRHRRWEGRRLSESALAQREKNRDAARLEAIRRRRELNRTK